MKARDVNRRIERLSGKLVREVGSHRRYAVSFTDPTGAVAKAFTTVPQYRGNIPTTTLRAIERDLRPPFGIFAKGWLRA